MLALASVPASTPPAASPPAAPASIGGGDIICPEYVPEQESTLTLDGSGWQTGPTYAKEAVPALVVGHAGDEAAATSSSRGGMPARTSTGGGVGRNENAPIGWTATSTVTSAVPELEI